MDGTGGATPTARTYLALVTHPDADRDQLAALLGIERPALDDQLEAMAAEGSISLREDGGWHVPPPDITLTARAGQLEREALRIRASADELATIYHRARAATSGSEQPIEILPTQEEVARSFFEVLGGARARVRSLDRPPYLNAAQAVTDVQRQRSAEGVRFLTVYDTSVLEAPPAATALTRLRALGEQVRVLRGVPLKMVIADDETALVMLRTPQDAWRGSMLVRRSPLLESLTTLFETLWRLSVPLPRNAPPLAVAADAARDLPTARDRQVLVLLAGGATDETIARQLGLSTRTVERRVRAMLDRLGAETRFQAGVQAARRGWL